MMGNMTESTLMPPMTGHLWGDQKGDVSVSVLGSQASTEWTNLRNRPLEGGGDHAEDEAKRDPDIGSMRTVELLGKRPSDGRTVQALDFLTTEERSVHS